MPVQHDHYVALQGLYSGTFEIYRAEEKDRVIPAVDFGPEHQWLTRAVAFVANDHGGPGVVQGAVHSGLLTDKKNDFFVEDSILLHRVCYEMIGQPKTWLPQVPIPEPAILVFYKQQLFDFEAFVRHSFGWMLVDPRWLKSESAHRNNERLSRAAKFYSGHSTPESAETQDLFIETLINYFFEKGATSLTLNQGQSPIFETESGHISHPFGSFPSESYFRSLHALIGGDFLKGDGMQVPIAIDGLGEASFFLFANGEGLHAALLRDEKPQG